MDDISRELPPDETGAAPVSERQKGPEELQRFELGHVGDDTDGTPQFGNRLAGMGAPFLAERFLSVSSPTDSSLGDSTDDSTGDSTPVSEGAAEGSPSDGVPIGDGGRDQDASPADESGAGDEPQQGARPNQGAVLDQTSVEGSVDPDVEDVTVAASVPEEQPSQGGDAEVSVDEASVAAPLDQDASGEVSDEASADEELADEDPVDEGLTGEDSTDEDSTDEDSAEVDGSAAQAAVAAEASTMELDSVDDLVDSELGEDGLPIVPDLTDAADVARMVYVMMMTSREGMTVFRLARACNTTQKLVEEGLELLREQLRGLGLPVELTRVGDTVRWMSGASAFPYLQRLRGVKKLEKLSPAALETLAVIAYRQPVMRSEIEAIRGVKAGPMLRTLLQHKLACVAGRADVPGRPLQYGTTQQFLERFGLASLEELPSVKEWKNLG